MGCFEFLLALPCALLLIVMIMGFFGSASSSNTGEDVAAFAMLGVLGFPFVLLSWIGALIGLFLMRTKRILKCGNCGASIDADG